MKSTVPWLYSTSTSNPSAGKHSGFAVVPVCAGLVCFGQSSLNERELFPGKWLIPFAVAVHIKDKLNEVLNTIASFLTFVSFN